LCWYINSVGPHINECTFIEHAGKSAATSSKHLQTRAPELLASLPLFEAKPAHLQAALRKTEGVSVSQRVAASALFKAKVTMYGDEKENFQKVFYSRFYDWIYYSHDCA
jgi:hypothetical protein